MSAVQNERPITSEPIYNYLFTKLSSDFLNKKQTRNYAGTTSCRLSMLFFTIIALKWEYIKRIVDQVQTTFESSQEVLQLTIQLLDIVKLCLSDNKLKKFLLENSTDGTESELVTGDNFGEIMDRQTMHNIYTFGFVVNGGRTISHYFTIIKSLNNEFSIISAYGCDTTSIPQQEIPIKKKDFEVFIQAWENNETLIVNKFLRTYFFQNGEVVRGLTDDDGPPKQVTHTAEKGLELELMHTSETPGKSIMYFPRFVDDVNSIIESQPNESINQMRVERVRSQTAAKQRYARKKEIDKKRITKLGGSKIKTRKLRKTVKRRNPRKEKRNNKKTKTKRHKQ